MVGEKSLLHSKSLKFVPDFDNQRLDSRPPGNSLGHKSIRITEEHYSAWLKSRQEQLERDVRATWTVPKKPARPSKKIQTELLPEVHGRYTTKAIAPTD